MTKKWRKYSVLSKLHASIREIDTQDRPFEELRQLPFLLKELESNHGANSFLLIFKKANLFSAVVVIPVSSHQMREPIMVAI